MDTCLFGRQCEDHGASLQEIVEGGVVLISPGADPLSPARRYKRAPNEDALLYRREGRRALLVIADAHFGLGASHQLIARWHQRPGIPATPEALALALAELPELGLAHDGSESTLLVVVYDFEARAGFGQSFGDSSLFIVRGPRLAQRVSPQNGVFLDPSDPARFDEGQPFEFTTRPDQLLLAFTDGIDECCYRAPSRSIGPRHLTALYAQHGPAPQIYARALLRLALNGVEGHPGGQDNIALIALRA
ncbi:SpoIIE family protein phosphatase [Myxococcota bacterium]|nr:SpoIIE family protein phosphatase [Myxococcota bacterium]MBU1429245.1 SpoIIE family protein phosphatase [Myxococcota bacterium]MBU1897988.1 SpoIIE family protein phosphatase [Myxococcota bacterium]